MKDFIEDIAKGLDFLNVQAIATSFYMKQSFKMVMKTLVPAESDFLTAVNELYYIDSKDIDNIKHNNDMDTEIDDGLIETENIILQYI
eukprot:Awhi_evm2s10331